MSKYIMIKDNKVVNIAEFVEPSAATLDLFKLTNQVDSIVEFEGYINVGDGFDGTNRIPASPHNGWVLSEDGSYYLPPTNKPSDEHVWSDDEEDWVIPA